MNIPNKLVTARLITVPLIIISLYVDYFYAKLAATLLLIIAWLTDFFDGRIARKRGMQTNFGAFYDPFVDKILVTFTFIVLGDLNIIPMWLVILMLLRDYLVQGIRSMVKAEGVILKSEWSGKIKFVLQMTTLVFASLLWSLSYIYPSLNNWMLNAVFWVMIIATIEAYYALFEFLNNNKKTIRSWF